MTSRVSGTAAALFAAFTLLAGFGLGMVFGESSEGAPPGIAGDAFAAENAAGGDGGELRRTDGAVRRTTAATSAPIPVEHRVSPAEFERAKRTVDVTPGKPSGGGEQIAGKILTDLGEPLPGVVVVATLRRDSDPYGRSTESVGSGNPTDRSLEETLRQSADAWAGTRGRRYQGISGADGRYVIEGLPDARFSMAAYHPGYVLSLARRRYSVFAGDTCDFDARPVVEVDVRVLLPDGQQPDIAAVRVDAGGRNGGGEHLRWTPDQPVLRLSSKYGTAVALAGIVPGTGRGSDALAEYRSEPVTIDGAGSIVLQLEARSGIHGRLRGASSSYSNEVKLLDLAAEPDPSAEAFGRSTQRSRASSGMFRFVDLEPGRYAIGMLNHAGTLLASAEVDVADGLVRQDLEVPPPTAADSVRVSCLNPDGRPLPGVTFSYSAKIGDSNRSGGLARPIRDDEGAYLIPSFSFAKLPVGKLAGSDFIEIEATHQHFGSCSGRLTGAMRELSLQFAEPCRLTVVIPGYEGHPMRSSMRVSVVERDESAERRNFSSYMGFPGSQSGNQGTIRADGTAEFPRLTPGSWRVRLLLTANRYSSREIGHVDVELRAAEQQVSLAAPPLYDVEIVAPDVDVGAQISLSEAPEPGADGNTQQFVRMRGWGMGMRGSLDDDHRCVIRNVPAGRYRVGSSGASRSLEIVVPGGPFLLEVPTYDCLRVSISDQEGTLYRAGLRPGDLVVAINGVQVNASNHWSVLRGEGRTTGVPLTVLRDGERVTIQGGDEPWVGDAAGGTMRAASTREK